MLNLRMIMTAALMAMTASALSCGARNDSAVKSSADGAPLEAAATGGRTLAPPKEAQWTIACYTIQDPNHVALATELKKAPLLQSAPVKDWYVVHEEGRSTLYCGYYATIEQARADAQKVRAMRDGLQNRPFAEAMPVPVSAPDPTAPPEWNLVNAKGFWSLQIAAYQGTGRKEAAVESVKEARKSGIEAYYFHGPSVSSVCIGAWPEEAIARQDSDGSRGSGDPTQPILVIGGGTDVKEWQKRNPVDRDGRAVKVLEQKVEVVDPTMKATMEQYKYHSLNGVPEALAYNTGGREIEALKPSLLVQIPRAEPSILADHGLGAPPTMLSPQSGKSQSGGRLRSLDGR